MTALSPESGRQARMTASVRYPSMCIRHRRYLRWIPAPGWWIHDRGSETCSAMWDAKAPEPAEELRP